VRVDLSRRDGAWHLTIGPVEVALHDDERVTVEITKPEKDPTDA
jgi:hypothetical protein